MHEGINIWENVFPTIYDIKAYCAGIWIPVLPGRSMNYLHCALAVWPLSLIFLIFKTYLKNKIISGSAVPCLHKKEFNSFLFPTSPIYSQSKVYVNLTSGKLDSLWNSFFFFFLTVTEINCQLGKYCI